MGSEGGKRPIRPEECMTPFDEGGASSCADQHDQEMPAEDGGEEEEDRAPVLRRGPVAEAKRRRTGRRS
eukprot:15785476-Heterocapsa_arctica.AAC.2